MEKGKKWYQTPSNWLFIIACVILIPMLLMNLSIMFQAKANEDKVPSVFGLKPFMVLSGSMEPGIKKGDLIITKVIDPETLKIDDVIAFRDSQNTVTTHRIIDIVTRNNSNYFITKGDNNASQDQNLVSLSDVEGLFVMRIPGIGSVMSSLAEPTTIVILVLGITVIFVIAFMISSKKQMGKEDADYLEYKRMREQGKQKYYDDEEDIYPTQKNEERNQQMQYDNLNRKSFEQKKDRYSDNQYSYDDEDKDYLDQYIEESSKPKQYNNNHYDRNYEYQKNKYSNNQQRYELEEEDIHEYKKRVEQLEEEKYNRNETSHENRKEYSNSQQRYDKGREKSFEYKKMNRQDDRRGQEDKNQEFFEYKKRKEQEERQTQLDKEREEFLEYKRMKEQQERQKQEDRERQEFLAYKRMKEQQENSRHKK